MKKRIWFLTLAVSAFSFASLGGQASVGKVTVPAAVASYPEIVIYNARIIAMDDRGVNLNLGTIAEAMAVRNGEIMALGSSETIVEYAGPTTKKFNLKGRTVIPGIINTHIHLHDGALSKWLEKKPGKSSRSSWCLSDRGRDA